jgi:hypothetical protein
MGNAIFPEEATVYITPIAITASSLASTDAVTAEVTNFSQSGGEEDVESVPVFGGGNIDKTKPRTMIEVSFDVVLRYDAAQATMLRWDALKFGTLVSSTSTIKSNTSSEYQRIYVQWTNGTQYYTRAYNNVKAVTFEPESSADEYLKGTITFKCSPTTADNIANHQIKSLAASTVVWS